MLYDDHETVVYASVCGAVYYHYFWDMFAVFLGRLLRVDQIKWVSNVRPSSRPYIRTSVRPSTKSFLDFSDIWYVDRGRWVMYDGVQYDRIQGQGQGHEPLKAEH